jgi:Bacteriophage Lambda NinG protein
MQTTCGYECAIKYTQMLREKKQKSDKRKAIKQFSDRDIPTLKRVAQTIFNKYIRLRDAALPCISCGYDGSSRQWHAGHYLSQGGHSQLRYDERNVHKQCSICNNHLSGNLAEYRKELINRIGLAEVEALESNKQTKRYTAEELKEIIERYKQKVKNLQN